MSGVKLHRLSKRVQIWRDYVTELDLRLCEVMLLRRAIKRCCVGHRLYYTNVRNLSSCDSDGSEEDRKALEVASRALLCANLDHSLNKTQREKEGAFNPILQNLRALNFFMKSNYVEADAILQDVVELMRGPMMGLQSDSYIDIGGVLSDLGLVHMSQGKWKDAELVMKRSLMMATKAYKVNVHLHTGVLANLCELYRRTLDAEKATSFADKLLVELNNSKGGHEMSTKSRWGGDGVHSSYSWLWSDLCMSDIRSAQLYFAVARANANFRSVAEATIHFNSGFRAMSVHIESFTTVRVHGVAEIEAVGGSLAHIYPVFVQGCIDLATVKAINASKGSPISPKPDYLAAVCKQLAPLSGEGLGIGSDWEPLMATALAVIQGKEGNISKEAVDYLMISYNAAKDYIKAHSGGEGATGVIETGPRHVVGLALLDARFHME